MFAKPYGNPSSDRLDVTFCPLIVDQIALSSGCSPSFALPSPALNVIGRMPLVLKMEWLWQNRIFLCNFPSRSIRLDSDWCEYGQWRAGVSWCVTWSANRKKQKLVEATADNVTISDSLWLAWITYFLATVANRLSVLQTPSLRNSFQYPGLKCPCLTYLYKAWSFIKLSLWQTTMSGIWSWNSHINEAGRASNAKKNCVLMFE